MIIYARATRGLNLPSGRWENGAGHFGENRLLIYPRFLFPGLVRQVRGRFVDSHVDGGRHSAEAPGRSTYLL